MSTSPETAARNRASCARGARDVVGRHEVRPHAAEADAPRVQHGADAVGHGPRERPAPPEAGLDLHVHLEVGRTTARAPARAAARIPSVSGPDPTLTAIDALAAAAMCSGGIG